MRNRNPFSLVRPFTILSLIAVLTALSPAQVTQTILHDFTFHADGSFPWAGLTFDAAGNAYGISAFGGFIQGSICCGAVYQLVPQANGTWTFNLLHEFTGPVTDGEDPSGSVIFDNNGNLYGTTQQGGWCGVAYELSPTASGPWKETILHLFNNVDKGVYNDGCTPSSALVFDQAGNLYGTTQGSGLANCTTTACGTVFELSPTADGTWKETILHRFPAGTGDGSSPYGALAFDHNGNLWGTTQYGGTAGTVFRLSKNASDEWHESVAFNFTGSDTGYNPFPGVIIDSSDRLYGTAFYGGSSGAGVVYELTPQSNGMLTETLLHQFAGCSPTICPDGLLPWGGLAFDQSGNIYGTTIEGGGGGTICGTMPQDGCGVVYELSPGSGGSWSYKIVFRLAGGDQGAYMTDDHLTLDANGNIFGTTTVEGTGSCPQYILGLGGCGVVFKLTP